jgi:hypothetical protein
MLSTVLAAKVSAQSTFQHLTLQKLHQQVKSFFDLQSVMTIPIVAEEPAVRVYK